MNATCRKISITISETGKGKARAEVIGGLQFKYSKSFTLHVRATSSF